MRILLTADPEIPVPPKTYGGIERIVDGLITELRSRGHQVGLVAHPESTVATDGFFPWPGAASQRKLDTFKNAMTLKAAVKSFKPEILHSFSRLAYMFPIIGTKLPKIMSYQRDPSLRTTKWARRLSRGTLRFTGCSEYICKLGRKGGGDWTPIHNFVELNKFTFQPSVSDDAPLVFLSRIEPIKGTRLAIDIAKQAGKKLIIAGNHYKDGENGKYWDEQIVQCLGPDVEYVGPVNDVQKNELLGKAAAMLVPVQWDEPFGIVFAESLACGTPVISCPRGALPEIVREGKDGFLADNLGDLVLKIGRLPLVDRIDCRHRIESQFTAEIVVEKYCNLYRETLSGA